MSSLLRVSKLISRQRVLSQQRILTNTSLSCRRESSSAGWAPAAYRSQRQKPRGKRRPGAPKKMGRGRDGLWKALQETYGETFTAEKQATATKETRDDWKIKRQFRREEQLTEAQQEFRAVIHRYRNALFPESTSKESRKASLERLLHSLHDLCIDAAEDKDSLAVSMDTIVATDDQFRDLGKLTRQLISLVARMPNDAAADDDENDDGKHENSVVAEVFLRGLIELKEDRALLVRRAKEVLKQEQDAKMKEEGGLMGWIKGVFVQSPGEDEQEPAEEETASMAHEEPSFGPTKRQYVHVIKSIKHDAYQFKWEPPKDCFDGFPTAVEMRADSKEAREALLECADRMRSLLELHLEHGGVPATSLTAPTIDLYSQVGSLHAANKAKEIYLVASAKKVPRDVFHSLLRAYRLAALMESTPANRGAAASTAINLLRDREQYSLASYYSNSNFNDPRGESYALVLETLLNAGQKAFPDRIFQAETLVKLYLGETLFNQVVGYRKMAPTSHIDIYVFESLLLMYASKGGEHKLVQMAKNILHCAEDHQPKASVPDNESGHDEEKHVFPNTRAYNAILNAIQMKIKHILTRSRRIKNSLEIQKAQNIARDEAIEVTAFLDRMTETCPPDLKTFEMLLEIWAMVESPESVERAEDILSRMSIRQACSRSNDAWSDSSRLYSHLLHCWATGKEASSSVALRRALRVVDKMEAQSGIQYMPGSDASGEEKEIFQSVYEKSEPVSYRAAYNGALKICSICREDPGGAFQAAFDIYNRMIAAGVTPDQETFKNLFASCLLPRDDVEGIGRRKELATTVIAFASDHGMNTTEMTKQMQRAFHIRKRGTAR